MNRSDIIVTTANARYSHCAFALKRLWTALDPSLRAHARTIEFTIQDDPFSMAETLLAHQPALVGFSVYIWNVGLLNRVAGIIRAVRPETLLVAGGPEITADSPFIRSVDYAVVGEGEEAFSTLAARLLAGERPERRVVLTAPPSLDALPCPYDAYTDEDIEHRVIYVESSRGCPYRCAFCLSAHDAQVRYFPLAPFLNDMARLFERGVRQFKFTDRTFNVSDKRMIPILEFFLDRASPEMRLHFEIMPERLSDAVFALMAKFPPACLHLEVGVQSVNQATQQLIGRNQDIDRSQYTIKRLLTETGAALHADLIIGLPGDGLDDIAAGFNMLVQLGVHEIQVGLLKRLRGTAMAGSVGDALHFDMEPPYEVLQTPHLSFVHVQTLKRLARYFDLYYNRGNFPQSLSLLWQIAATPFAGFSAFAEYLWTQEKRTHHLPLARLAHHLYAFLCVSGDLDAHEVAQAIEQDFRRYPGRKDRLPFLNR